MALYKSNNYDFIKFFESLCRNEIEKVFKKNLNEDVLLPVWKSIQNNHPLELLDQTLVDDFKREIDEEKSKLNFWNGN